MSKFYLLNALFFSAPLFSFAQNVGIGTATPNTSAKLDIVDANRGILLPRVSLTATNVAGPVATPANWLVVFNTATAGAGATAVSPGMYYWDGTQWVRLQSGPSMDWALLGNAATNPATNFIGTTDAQDFVTRTNNVERTRVTSAGRVGIGTPTPSSALTVVERFSGSTTGLLPYAGGPLPGVTVWDNSDFGGITTVDLDGSLATTNDAGTMIYWGDDGNEPLLFSFMQWTGSALTRQDRMTLTPAGNLGINTATPAERLHVVGNIRSSALAGTGNRMVASDANGTLTNIAAGTNGQILTMVAGAPAWAAPAVTNWTLTGNAATNPATNFIGTTDAQDFVTRTNNAERMRITSAGNMGIGTTAPGARLHVAGGAIRPESGNIVAAGINWGADVFGGGGDMASLRYYSEGGENTKLLLNNQNDADDDITMEAGFLLFRTGDPITPITDRMIITTAGNIGINTATPAERLHVVGNIRSSALAGTGNRMVASDANGTLTNIAAGTNGQVLTMVAGAPSWAAPAVTNWTLTGNAGTSAATNFLGTTDAVDFVTRTNNAERMRITSAGSVGIGTAAPSALLHVAGGAIRPESGNVAAAGINWGADVFGGGGDEASIRYYGEGGENTKLMIANQNDADDDITMEAGFLLFRTGDGGTTIADADRMIITTAGNVGVNTNSPNTLFQVNAGTSTANLNPAAISINRAATNVEGSLWFMTGGAARWILQQDNDGTENLRLWSTATGSFLQTWNHTNGAVGINNNNPTATLDVNGTIAARDVFGAGGQNILVGDDAFLSDIDVSNMMGIRSTTGTNAALVAGSTNNSMFVGGANNYIHGGGNQVFGSGGGYMQAASFSTTGNTSGETGGIYADGNAVTIWSPGDANGTAPAALLYFVDEDFWDAANTDPYDNTALKSYINTAGALVSASDIRRKNTIMPISNALAKITSIGGYEYYFNLAAAEVEKGDKATLQSGVLAQELKKEIPTAVEEAKNGDLFVNYSAITPYLIEAVKEQQQQIELLKKQNELLEQRLKSLEEQK